MQKPKPLGTIIVEGIPEAVNYVLSMPDPVLWVGAIIGIFLLGGIAMFILMVLEDEPIQSAAGSITALIFGVLAYAILAAIATVFIGTLLFFTWTFWAKYLG